MLKNVSTPLDSYRNGNGAAGGFNPAGTPEEYFADCASTPDSDAPSGFASSAPTARWFTNSR